MSHDLGAIFISDRAQGAPHLKVDVKDLDCVKILKLKIQDKTVIYLRASCISH